LDETPDYIDNAISGMEGEALRGILMQRTPVGVENMYWVMRTLLVHSMQESESLCDVVSQTLSGVRLAC